MSLHSIIGGFDAFHVRQRASQDTEIQQVLAEWRSPAWRMDELWTRYRDPRTCSVIRSIEYWPDGRIKSIDYEEPSYTKMLYHPKPWVLLGTYRGEGLFTWEHRYL